MISWGGTYLWKTRADLSSSFPSGMCFRTEILFCDTILFLPCFSKYFCGTVSLVAMVHLLNWGWISSRSSPLVFTCAQKKRYKYSLLFLVILQRIPHSNLPDHMVLTFFLLSFHRICQSPGKEQQILSRSVNSLNWFGGCRLTYWNRRRGGEWRWCWDQELLSYAFQLRRGISLYLRHGISFDGRYKT